MLAFRAGATSRGRARAASLLLTALLVIAGHVRAQTPAPDRVVLKTGEQQVGKVLGVSNGQVQLEISTGSAAGRLTFNLAQISRVEASAPAAYTAGVAAFEAGDFDRALAALKPVAETFRGLPTDWARDAAALLGDIYLEKKDLARAEAAYADYAKVYGGGGGGDSVRTTVSLARLALAKGDAAGARARLEPLAAAALQNPLKASSAEAAAYGQVFLLLGRQQEAAGDWPAALTSYLRTVTLFYRDRAAVAAAQKAADALRAVHPGVIAP